MTVMLLFISDATYIPLKRKTVMGSYRSWHSPGRIKGSIGICGAPSESITIWEEILLDLQERGLKNVLCSSRMA